ncbi:MAG: DUF503 domain-containing protein [Acidobacteriota bacterium]|nr:DUF503 domain-containing protein [Acidobacteriota bacterium]
MFVGVTVCELHLPGVRSLKEKRKVIKSLVERIHRRYRVSVAETDFHDLHQRAEISIAVVGNRYGEMENLLEDLRRVFDAEPAAMVSGWYPRVLEEAR